MLRQRLLPLPLPWSSAVAAACGCAAAASMPLMALFSIDTYYMTHQTCVSVFVFATSLFAFFTAGASHELCNVATTPLQSPPGAFASRRAVRDAQFTLATLLCVAILLQVRAMRFSQCDDVAVGTRGGFSCPPSTL